MDTWVQKTWILANLLAVCPLTPPSLVGSQSQGQTVVKVVLDCEQQFKNKCIYLFSVQTSRTISLHLYLDMGGMASTR